MCSYIGDGLHYVSGGLLAIRWDLFSNQTCNLRYYWYFQSDSLSQYLLLALALERVVSLYRPLAVRVWATQRNGYRLLALLIVFSVILAAPTISDFEIREYSLAGYELRCLLWSNSWLQLAKIVLLNVFLCLSLPRIGVFVCTLILSRKIRAASAAHRLLGEPRAGGHNRIRRVDIERDMVPRRELRLARPVFIFALLELLVTSQLLITWAFYHLFRALDCPPEWIEVAGACGRVALYLTIVSRIWNLWVYCATIPGFKHEILRILRCRRHTRRLVLLNDPLGAPQRASSRASLGDSLAFRSRLETAISDKAQSIVLSRHHTIA